MQKWFGAVFPILSILLLLWIEQSVGVSYGVKTVAKVILFLAIPLMLFRSTKFPFLRFQNADRKSIRLAFILGISIMALIIGVFLLLQQLIDIASLRDDLLQSGITPAVFPFIALYILIGNSIIEEFFFGGCYLAFSAILKYGSSCHHSFSLFTISQSSCHGLPCRFYCLLSAAFGQAA